MIEKCALLLSGGMDSLCIAWWKQPDVAITIDYGQLPASAEIAASAAICDRLSIEHHIVQVDCRALGSGDMAGTAANTYASATDWWPYRNQLLITVAAMKAIGLGVSRLLIGTVRSDNLHCDGTPDFIALVSDLMARQEGNLVVEAPAITMMSGDLVRKSGVPPEVLAWSHSCHKADVPCGECRGCNKYFAVLEEIQNGLDRIR